MDIHDHQHGQIFWINNTAERIIHRSKFRKNHILIIWIIPKWLKMIHSRKIREVIWSGLKFQVVKLTPYGVSCRKIWLAPALKLMLTRWRSCAIQTTRECDASIWKPASEYSYDSKISKWRSFKINHFLIIIRPATVTIIHPTNNI